MLKSCFILLSLVSSALIAQNSDFSVAYLNPKTGIPAMLRFNPQSNNRPGPENLSSWMQQNLYANAAFRMKFVHSVKGSDGLTHLRYQQFYGRFKVEAGELILHQKDRKTVSMNGKYFPDLQADTSIGISPAEAIQKALALYPDAVFMWELPSEQALLKKTGNGKRHSYYPQAELMLISLHDSCRNSDFRLAYKLDVYAYAPQSRAWIYIDALTGRVLDREEQICNIDRVGIAHTKYSGIKNITCDSIAPDTFVLRESSRGNGIETIDVRVIGLDSSRAFIDHDNVWNNVNAFKDEVATDVHWGTGVTYDYFKQYHNRSSYDDSDGYILSKVHVGTKYVNAFWDGNTANYGDGDGINYTPLTSIEICAHELSHGVTQHTARLRYRNESGALNESFSDIFGKSVEHYADTTGFDWLIAGKITLKNKPFRNMAFPPAQSHPKYYYGTHYYQGTLDNGGVHSNSGVQNFWFYLLCEGGSGMREADSLAYTVEAIGMEKAARIAYLTLSTDLIRESEYIDACYLSIEAAANLYGENSFEYKQVQKAWFAVGLLSMGELSANAPAAASAAWSIYPNPGTDFIRIQNPLVYEAVQTEVFDISGKLLLQASVMPNEALNLSALHAGIYFIRINGNTVLKWVKS